MFKRTTIQALFFFTLLLCGGAAYAAPTFKLNDISYELTKADGNTFTFTAQADESETVQLIYEPQGEAKEALREFTDVLRDDLKAKGQLKKAHVAKRESGEFVGYLLVGYYMDGESIVAVMTRTLTSDVEDTPKSVAVVYEHRFSGENQQQDMIAWFNAHGRDTEGALLSLKGVATEESLAQAE